MTVLCECSNPTCIATVDLRVDEFNITRADGARFALGGTTCRRGRRVSRGRAPFDAHRSTGERVASDATQERLKNLEGLCFPVQAVEDAVAHAPVYVDPREVDWVRRSDSSRDGTQSFPGLFRSR